MSGRKKSDQPSFLDALDDELEVRVNAALGMPTGQASRHDRAGNAHGTLDDDDDDEVHMYERDYFDSDEEDDVKQRHKLTNDELFYDPDMDAEDEQWMRELRMAGRPGSGVHQPQGSARDSSDEDDEDLKTSVREKQGRVEQQEQQASARMDVDSDAPPGYYERHGRSPASTNGQQGRVDGDRLLDNDQQARRRRAQQKNTDQSVVPAPTTDAVLNCPSCLSTLCVDCQRHEVHTHQYRAMFTLGCRVDFTSAFLQESEGRRSKKKRGKRGKSRHQGADAMEGQDGATDGDADSDVAQPKYGDDNVFLQVHCAECNEMVAVYDRDEVYHFFNVLASHA